MKVEVIRSPHPEKFSEESPEVLVDEYPLIEIHSAIILDEDEVETDVTGCV